jgi:hypothetical protein
MRSKRQSICSLCRAPIHVGDEIHKWKQWWVHGYCRTSEIEKIRNVGNVTILPEYRGWADDPQWITTKAMRKKGLKRFTKS